MKGAYHLGSSRLQAEESRLVAKGYGPSVPSPAALRQLFYQSPSEESNLIVPVRSRASGSAGSMGMQSAR